MSPTDNQKIKTLKQDIALYLSHADAEIEKSVAEKSSHTLAGVHLINAKNSMKIAESKTRQLNELTGLNVNARDVLNGESN